MADFRLKVRRQAYFVRGIKCASTVSTTGKITADVGINTTSGSVSTFSGGLTAASTMSVTGSLISGTGGTPVAGILCGSAAVAIGATASATSATCFPVAGLTAAHKIFLSSGSLSGCLIAGCPEFRTGTTPCLHVVFWNPTTEDVTAGTSTLFYLAVLDK